MDNLQILEMASNRILTLSGKILDIVDISKPKSVGSAAQQAKLISKLSPLIGNMIEYTIVDLLNDMDWQGLGNWVRQDPGFPDAIFLGENSSEIPGIEIKAWFPIATEVTARFRESVALLSHSPTNVVIIAWIPENIIYGKPVIIDALVCSAYSVAAARDLHYHKPPHYLVIEPENTSMRTSNLKQTNTNGYVFQGNIIQLEQINREIEAWKGEKYSTDVIYQRNLKKLIGKYNYRLDTNFAKLDRIGHNDIENFKLKVLNTPYKGKKIKEWAKLLLSSETETIKKMLSLD